MQGTWKSNVSGWNHKDSKRKKQTRKHYLKDRGLYYLRKSPKSVVRFESEVEYIDDVVVKNGEYRTIYLIKIFKWNDIVNTLSYKQAYKSSVSEFRNTWCDSLTGEELPRYYRVNIVKELYKEYVHFNEPKAIKRKNKYCYASSNETMFINNVLLEDWKRWTFYSDGKRRKYAQKYASSMDRRIMRDWINKGDWNAEIKTHALSKSILWEIW